MKFVLTILVLYYSQTGTTGSVAEEIAKSLGADVVSFDVEMPYNGDYQQTIARCQKEMAEGFVPALKPLDIDLSKYDVIFLGYPVWFGTYATPVAALVKEYDFAGKKIVPFCTFGSGGLESSAADLKAALPEAEICEGYGVRTSRLAAAPKEIDRFLKEGGYLEGDIAPLPEYSEQQPVTEADVAVFDAACGSYQFPLGTPATVGSRTTPDGTDYKYIVNATGMDGKPATFTIYVTVAAGSQPEFTRVVR